MSKRRLGLNVTVGQRTAPKLEPARLLAWRCLLLAAIWMLVGVWPWRSKSPADGGMVGREVHSAVAHRPSSADETVAFKVRSAGEERGGPPSIAGAPRLRRRSFPAILEVNSRHPDLSATTFLPVRLCAFWMVAPINVEMAAGALGPFWQATHGILAEPREMGSAGNTKTCPKNLSKRSPQAHSVRDPFEAACTRIACLLAKMIILDAASSMIRARDHREPTGALPRSR
jgi:hypothetical protein